MFLDAILYKISPQMNKKIFFKIFKKNFIFLIFGYIIVVINKKLGGLKMKDFKSLNVYLSNIAVMTTKLHNLHWNVEGRNFYQTHIFTEGLYEKFFDWYDEVAEAIKKKGGFPFASLKDYVANATIAELDSKKVIVDEVNEIVMNDLVAIKEEAIKIREEADNDGDFIIVDMLEDHIGELEKNIWFLRASKPCCNN